MTYTRDESSQIKMVVANDLVLSEIVMIHQVIAHKLVDICIQLAIFSNKTHALPDSLLIFVAWIMRWGK